MTPSSFQRKFCAALKEAHLKFATKVYEHTFDESKMTTEEIESKRSQIPTLGIVPFEAAWNECLKFLMQSSEWADVKTQLDRANRALTCGAAEYVPAIPEAWAYIDDALATIRAMESAGE